MSTPQPTYSAVAASFVTKLGRETRDHWMTQGKLLADAIAERDAQQRLLHDVARNGGWLSRHFFAPPANRRDFARVLEDFNVREIEKSVVRACNLVELAAVSLDGVVYLSIKDFRFLQERGTVDLNPGKNAL